MRPPRLSPLVRAVRTTNPPRGAVRWMSTSVPAARTPSGLDAPGLPSTFVPGFHDERLVRQMPFRRLGRHRVASVISLGTSAFGGVFGPVQADECVRLTHAALRAGVNVIDSAPWYGHGESERVTGLALQGIPRSAFFLHTKVGRYLPHVADMFDFSADRVKLSVDESLRRLGVDYLDTIQVHDPEFAPSLDIIVRQTLPTLADLRRQGLVRSIGITGYPLSTLRELAARSVVELDTCISYCRLALHDTSLADSGLATSLAQDHHVGVLNASALAMGLLTQQGPPAWHPASANLKARCRAAAALCAQRGTDLARLALHFSLARPEVSTTLVSAADVTTMETNLRLARGESPLTPTEEATLAELRTGLLSPDALGADAHWEGVEVRKYWEKLGRALELQRKYPDFVDRK